MTLKYFVFFCDVDGQKNPLNASVMTFRCTELIGKEFSLRNSNSHLVSSRNPRNRRQLSHFMEPVNCRNIFKSSRALTENLDNFTIFISRNVRVEGKIDEKRWKGERKFNLCIFTISFRVSSNLTQKY
jgi:hypothetical protein